MPDVASADTTLLEPITAETPAGRDLTYEPHVEHLASEVEKTTSIAGDLPDWRLIRQESARILREEAKDLRVASWWVVAGGIVEGWAAAAEGVLTYAALVEKFWPVLYPPTKRMRARAALLAWLWENLARATSWRAVALEDADAIRALEAAVIALNESMNERLGDANPGVGALRSVLREKIKSIPLPPPPVATAATAAAGAPQQASAPSASPSVSAGPAPPEAATVTTLDEAEAVANRWRDTLSTLARQARMAAPTAPWPYRLARLSAWLTIEAAPDVEAGKTFVRAPPASDRNALEELFTSGAWDALRDAAEDALSEHIFWFDLHRYSAVALERLGAPFASARTALGRETAALFERLPSLASMHFSNGTPFASPETADWLVHERSAAFGTSQGPSLMSTGASGDAFGAVLQECEALSTAGKVDEALAKAMAAAEGIRSAPGRFRARLGIAKMAHRKAKANLALALLDELVPEVDATLEKWEPDLCAALFENLLQVLRVVSPEDADRQNLLFRRLLRLNPAAALRLET